MPTGLAIRHIEGKPGKVYYPLDLVNIASRQPKDNEVVIKMTAAALNHRDYFERQALYPGLGFGVPLLSDGCGVVTSTGSSAKQWLNKRVVINPGIGWDSDPVGPESPKGYITMGGTKLYPLGTAVDEMVIDAGQVEEAPAHLDAVQAAAIPLAGLTAWRSLITKSGEAKPGRNILVTGIGGGVALFALQFAVNAKCNVFVTSGSQEKIDKAVQLGAKGGVSYKEKDWNKKLQEMLPKERKSIDAIIDGAAGDVVDKAVKLLKPGGTIVQYGMTVGPKMQWSMNAVMKNIDLRGSTMGSRKEFRDMIQFCKDTKLSPLVSRVSRGGLKNLTEIDGLFEDMGKGAQFGKLCIEIAKENEVSKL